MNLTTGRSTLNKLNRCLVELILVIVTFTPERKKIGEKEGWGSIRYEFCSLPFSRDVNLLRVKICVFVRCQQRADDLAEWYTLTRSP